MAANLQHLENYAINKLFLYEPRCKKSRKQMKMDYFFKIFSKTSEKSKVSKQIWHVNNSSINQDGDPGEFLIS